MAPQLDTTLIDERAVILANSRRQLVLYYLYENDGEISLEEVSQTIAAVEADFATQSVDSDAVRHVYDTLYMTHVPVLIEYDLVEYDYEEGMLRSTGELEEFLQLSGDSREQQRRWFLYYGVPAAVLTGTVLALYFELVRESVSVLFGLTLGSALLLLCLPLVKYIDTRTILSGE